MGPQTEKLDDLDWHQSSELPRDEAVAFGGFLVAWLAERNLLPAGTYIPRPDSTSPGELYESFGGVLTSDDVIPELRGAFATYVGGQYPDDFGEWASQAHTSRVSINTWDAYDRYSPKLSINLSSRGEFGLSEGPLHALERKYQKGLDIKPEDILATLECSPEDRVFTAHALRGLATRCKWPRLGCGQAPLFDWAIACADFVERGVPALLRSLERSEILGILSGIVRVPTTLASKSDLVQLGEAVSGLRNDNECGALRLMQACVDRLSALGGGDPDFLHRVADWAIAEAMRLESIKATSFCVLILLQAGTADHLDQLEFLPNIEMVPSLTLSRLTQQLREAKKTKAKKTKAKAKKTKAKKTKAKAKKTKAKAKKTKTKAKKKR